MMPFVKSVLLQHLDCRAGKHARNASENNKSVGKRLPKINFDNIWDILNNSGEEET